MTDTATKRTAIVTGASAGIGAQYAEQLAAQGFDLILVARNRVRLNELASRLTNETRRDVQVVEADLETTAGIASVERILQTDASITLLVNNAGLGSISPALESDPDAMAAIINVNVTALTKLSMAAATAFAGRGHGAIVQISSVVAIKPEWINAVYAASKSYVLAYSQSLRDELEKKGVTVQVVLPATTSTDFWEAAGRPTASLSPALTMSPKDLVSSALAGLAQGEFITIPSLEDHADWQAYDDGRNALGPKVNRGQPASRYTNFG